MFVLCHCKAKGSAMFTAEDLHAVCMANPPLRHHCYSVSQCMGVLAEALRGAWKPYAAALIEPMILMGLSPTLVMALQVFGATLAILPSVECVDTAVVHAPEPLTICEHEVHERLCLQENNRYHSP